MDNAEKTIMDSTAMDRTMSRLAHEIIEHNEDISNICLIGILRRGVAIADVLTDKIEKFCGTRPLSGKLDISLYRDDLTSLSEQPIVNGTEIGFDVKGKTVILVDDVIYTGRTSRAAMDAVMKLGRPAKIQLAVLVDRGHRELPIRGDYIGKNIPTSLDERILVKFPEFDGTTAVTIRNDK